MLQIFGHLQKNDYLCTIKNKLITIKRIGDKSNETNWNGNVRL